MKNRLTNFERIEYQGCPKCGAVKGKPCKTKSGAALTSFNRGYRLHPERREAILDAMRIEAGQEVSI